MKRILFVLAIAAVTALITTPPIVARTAEPLLNPSVPILDVNDEAEKIADEVSQIIDWLLGNDDDKSEEQDNAFLDPRMPEAQFPRTPLQGDSVNRPVIGLTYGCAPGAYTAGAAVTDET